MKPYSHAVNSVKRYGGKVEDYLPDEGHLEEMLDDHVLVVCTADGIETNEFMDHD